MQRKYISHNNQEIFVLVLGCSLYKNVNCDMPGYMDPLRVRPQSVL